MKINFGCGSNILDGWKNHDAEMDVTHPLPYPDECAEIILAEHIGEHLTGPQLLRFLDECYRILKDGGVMRLCCPVIGDWLALEHARDLTLNHGHQLVLDAAIMRKFLWMAGFIEPLQTERKECDGHFRVIGIDKDDLETCRMEATK